VGGSCIGGGRGRGRGLDRDVWCLYIAVAIITSRRNQSPLRAFGWPESMYIPCTLSKTSPVTRPPNPDRSRPLLPTLPLHLPQRPLPDRLMHPPIPLNHNPVIQPHKRRQRPLHPRMAPKRRARVRPPLRPARAPNLPQHSLDKLLRRRHKHARAFDLGHGRRDQVALHQLDRDALGRQLAAERRAPLLQEGFAAGVCCEQWGREKAAEGAHGEDEATAALGHAGGYKLGYAQGGGAVDGDDVADFVLGGQGEGDGDVVAFADVVD